MRCNLAKRIWELQPELPDGISSTEMHVLDAVVELSAVKKVVYGERYRGRG